MAQNKFQIGEITDFGNDYYDFDKANTESFFIKLSDEKLGKEHVMWGKELEDLIKKEDLKVGDFVGLRNNGKTSVTVNKPIKNDNGEVVDHEKIDTFRNSFEVNRMDKEEYLNSSSSKEDLNVNTKIGSPGKNQVEIDINDLDMIESDQLQEPIKLSQHNKEKLANREETDLIENIRFADGSVRDGKFKISVDKEGDIKYHLFEKKPTLVLPKKIGKHKLSDDEITRLKNGEFVHLKMGNSEKYLQVDKELNAVIIKEPGQVGNPPDQIGMDYFLTQDDKNKLANGKPMDARLFTSDNGQTYFVGQFVFDKEAGTRGFMNVKVINDKQEALKLKEQLNVGHSLDDGLNTENIVNTTLNVKLGENTNESVKQPTQKEELSTNKQLDKELKEAIDNVDTKKLAELTKSKKVDDIQVIGYIDGHQKLSGKQKDIIKMTIGFKKDELKKTDISNTVSGKKSEVGLTKSKQTDLAMEGIKPGSGKKKLANKIKSGLDKGKGLVHDM